MDNLNQQMIMDLGLNITSFSSGLLYDDEADSSYSNGASSQYQITATPQSDNAVMQSVVSSQSQFTLTGPLSNSAQSGDDDDNSFSGTNSGDVLTGNAGDDTIFGGNGNDIIYGDVGTGGTSAIVFDGNQIVIEAEDYETAVTGTGHDWTQVANGGASEGFAMYVDDNGPNHIWPGNPEGNAPELQYSVNFTTTGTFYVWARGTGPNGNSDSIHIGFNGTRLTQDGGITGFSNGAGNFRWGNRDTYSGQPVEITINTPGVQVLNIWAREDGITLDKFLLTTDNIAAPTGLGPTPSLRGSDDILNGGNGNDTLYGNGGQDTINGGADNDRIYGGHDNDILNGDGGRDVIHAGNGDDTANGGDGNDSIFSGLGADNMDGGAGMDLLRYDNDTSGVTINLGTGAASGGFAAGDTFVNFEGVEGGSGNDSLTGSANVDRLFGNGGNDTLNGGDGNDILRGGNGVDIINGGNGNDNIYGDDGADIMDGGAGVDTLRYENDTTGVTINLTLNTALGGHATGDTILNFENVNGGQAGDTLTGNGVANAINGRGGDDVIDGAGGNDGLHGNAGNDTISGGDGDDRLYGDAGDDILNGGAGYDRLYGGSGADTFIFDTVDNNRVYDFSVGEGDILDISSLLTGFTGLSDIDDFLVFEQSGPRTRVMVDQDGVGGDYVQVAALENTTGLDAQTLFDNSQIIA